MSKELSNFLAGGLASNLYWGMALRECSVFVLMNGEICLVNV